MKIFITANEEQQKELRSHPDIYFSSLLPVITDDDRYDAFFILTDEWRSFDFKNFAKPIFINSVIDTLYQLGLPENVNRINAWPGFLQRTTWETAANYKNNIDPVFDLLQRKIITVKDEPGLVSARVISMIINEAFYALQEGVSTKEEIDTAMKLGTNYPYGPFEWTDKIGIGNVYKLLRKLTEKENRYQPSSLLEKSFLEK